MTNFESQSAVFYVPGLASTRHASTEQYDGSVCALPGSASTGHASTAQYYGSMRKLKAGVDYPIGGWPTHKQVQANNKAIAAEQRCQGQPQRLRADKRAAKKEAQRAKRRHVPVVMEQVCVPMDPYSTLGVTQPSGKGDVQTHPGSI